MNKYPNIDTSDIFNSPEESLCGRPKTHSFSGIGNVPSNYTWQYHSAATTSSSAFYDPRQTTLTTTTARIRDAGYETREKFMEAEKKYQEEGYTLSYNKMADGDIFNNTKLINDTKKISQNNELFYPRSNFTTEWNNTRLENNETENITGSRQVMNNISLYSRNRADNQIKNQKKKKGYQIMQLTSTIHNLNNIESGGKRNQFVNAYVLRHVPSSGGSSELADDRSTEQLPPPPKKDVRLELGYSGSGIRKKRIIASPGRSSFAFLRNMILRIMDFICSLGGNRNYYY
jgi:hypothetical protein